MKPSVFRLYKERVAFRRREQIQRGNRKTGRRKPSIGMRFLLARLLLPLSLSALSNYDTRRFSIKCKYRGSCTHSSFSKVCKRFGRGLRLRTAEKWYSSRYSLNVSSRCARYHPADETETERSSIRSFLKFHKKRIIPTNELILLSRRKRIVIVLSPRRTGRKQPLPLPPWIALHRRLPIQTLPLAARDRDLRRIIIRVSAVLSR